MTSMTTAFAVTTATACRRTTFCRRTAFGGLTAGSGTKHAELFFDITAGTFFALNNTVHTGYEFFKSVSAIFADIFVNRHIAPQMLFSDLFDDLTIFVSISVYFVKKHSSGQTGIFEYLQAFSHRFRRIFSHTANNTNADVQS